MNLGHQQRLFTKFLGHLIAYAYANGYALTVGEAYRTPEQAALNVSKGVGISNSLHTKRLAIDLNLFKDGVYLPNSESHTFLGTYWKSLHPLCRWGGDFKSKPDGNHYSMEWEGVK